MAARAAERTDNQVIPTVWQFIRKNRLCESVKTDNNLVMANAATAQIVSLDDYRRARASDRRTTTPPAPAFTSQTAPTTQMAPAVWVYWVPVWVW